MTSEPWNPPPSGQGPSPFRRMLRLAWRYGPLLLLLFVLSRLFLFRSSRPLEVPPAEPGQSARELTLVTLLPRDAIRAIDEPRFYGASQAATEYAPEEVVLGVELNGDARAYPTGLLSRHEIVNDTVGGVPIAVTW